MVRTALVGTGFVATRRAQVLSTDPRSQLMAVAGHNPTQTQTFAQTFGASAAPDWKALVQRDDIDLVFVAHINRDHGSVARAALEADKHVVVEYPLALNPAEAAAILALARHRQRRLHVAHIELLGGLHQAFRADLDTVGRPFYARYSTLAPRRPAGDSWTYCPELFGFPLIGALSRIHRLVDGFGAVNRIHSAVSYLNPHQPTAQGPTHYRTYLCSAQLIFASGLVADITYGKGEAIWLDARQLEVQGQSGGLRFEGNQGWRLHAAGATPLTVGSRRGLIGADTRRVLDHLTQGTPLYCRPEASLYSLQIADAARRSAAQGEAVDLQAVPYPPPTA